MFVSMGTLARRRSEPGGTVRTAFNTTGVHRNSNNPSAIAAFESSAGINRTMPGPIVDFAGGGPNTFDQRRGSINACLDAWAPLCVDGPYTLSLSLRPWPTALGGRLAEMAAGDYDAEYTADGNSFASRGYDSTNLILRPMWEFNGAFYPHSIVTSVNPGGATDFVAGWRRMYNRITAVVPGVQFDWCPLRLTLSPAAVEAAYPGDGYVQIIGFDAYNWRQGTDDLALRWQWLVQGGSTPGTSVGLDWHRNFAIAHNKLMSYPEYGVVNRGTQGNIGGDDDGTYMANIITRIGVDCDAGRMLYHAYFERDESSGNNNHMLHTYPTVSPVYPFPNAKAAYDAVLRG